MLPQTTGGNLIVSTENFIRRISKKPKLVGGHMPGNYNLYLTLRIVRTRRMVGH